MARKFSTMIARATPRIANLSPGAGKEAVKMTRTATTTGETSPGIVIGESAGIQPGSASGGGDGGGVVGG
jgi:hypothetical protein